MCVCVCVCVWGGGGGGGGGGGSILSDMHDKSSRVCGGTYSFVRLELHECSC